MTQDLFAALERLDSLLEAGIKRAEAAYGPAAAGDPFRGLHIDPAEVDRLLARGPGEAFLSANGGPAALPSRRWAALVSRFALSPFDLDVVVLALAPEVDLRYERFYAYLQDDVTRKRPTVELALNLLCSSASEKLARRDRFQADAPLLRGGVLRLLPDPGQPEPPLLARALRLDNQVIGFLLELQGLDGRLAPFCTLADPAPVSAHPGLPEPLEELVEPLAEAACAGTPLRLYLRGPAGLGRQRVAGWAAARAGKRLLTADLDRAAADGQPLADLLGILFREAAFQDAVCFLRGIDPLLDGRREADLRSLTRELAVSRQVVVLAGAESWSPLVAAGGNAPVAVRVVSSPMPSFARSRRAWRFELDLVHIKVADDDLDLLASRFRLTLAQIAEAAATAHPLAPAVAKAGLEDIMAAARRQTGHELGGLAVKLEPVFGWTNIVLPDDLLRQLRELCQCVEHRQQVLEDWGFGRKLSLGRGVSALFAGPPGTGKTMAAEIVARELGLDLYRIDLSGVVSKWVGETEKNLDRIFRAAGHANAILLFDEAEALFGKRSEVQDSHDRYANVEISYLLQKMEAYEGVAILATNRIEDLDEAFLRRLGFVMRFPFPEETERLRIWAAAWPADVPLADDLDWSGLARDLPFSGAEIKNAALGAAFLAAAAEGPVNMELLLHAARREYEKAGRSFSQPPNTHLPAGPGS